MAQIKNDRIPVVDFLRAFTLLGVAASNYMHFQNQGFHQTGINLWISAIEKIFFGPVWIILSFLFGFGFWSLIEKMKSQNQKLIPMFFKRMFWLFLIGMLNAVFYYGDILREDRKSTRLNSSHVKISYAVFGLKEKKAVHRPSERP